MNGFLTFLRSYRNGFFPFPYRKYMHKNKLIFIHIPRTGGTSILKLMAGKEKERDHSPWFQYKNSCPWAFKHYFKFAIVRNPWDRFVSVYKYLKKGGNGDKYDLFIRDYLNKYEDFTDFVLNGFPDLYFRNILLFMPQTYYICDLKNQIMVDEIIKFENLNEEIKKIQVFKNRNLQKINKSDDKNYKEFYNDETIAIIRKWYSNDIKTFGYAFE